MRETQALPFTARLGAAAGALRSLIFANRNDGPPDLDELWRDFNRKLSGLFGGKGGPGNNNNRRDPDRDGPGSGGGGPFQPDVKSAGIGAALIGIVALLIWLGSGFFIVQEGHQAVITTFGKYAHTKDAGFQWRFPYPIQMHEIVAVTQLQSVEVGRNTVVQATGLKDSSMLTGDENIIDIRFTVQYRRADARNYLFENSRPDEAVVMAAESAVREIVGRSRVDLVLYEQRDAIAAELVKQIQAQLDRVGAASRLLEESEGYRSRVVATAEGDAQRFRSVLTEYQKAPAVTRDRLYLDTMQQVYSNVSKVMVESRNGSNMLYLPLDRLLQQAGAPAPAAGAGTNIATPTPPVAETSAGQNVDIRSRDGGRARDREGR
jgi:membrane protease subunit HflK